jgi:hypothetical protein
MLLEQTETFYSRSFVKRLEGDIISLAYKLSRYYLGVSCFLKAKEEAIGTRPVSFEGSFSVRTRSPFHA